MGFDRREPSRWAALLGLAFDAKDDRKRITRGKDFFLCGGSEDTHSAMRDMVLEVHGRIEESGRELADVSVEELRELFHEVHRLGD